MIWQTFAYGYAKCHLKLITVNIFENLPCAKCFIFSPKTHPMTYIEFDIFISSILLEKPEKVKTGAGQTCDGRWAGMSMAVQ